VLFVADMKADVSALIVVPVYNHAGTLRSVVQASLAHGSVLVVDDGSTDMEPAHRRSVNDNIMPDDAFAPNHPLHALPIHYVRHATNMGKGKAIITGAAVAERLGMTHIITLDADAQHNPADIPAFLAAVESEMLTIFVGKRDFTVPNVPASSRFGRAFSNFWFRVQTGEDVGDSQSGFRAYPLAVLDKLTLTESHYSFEVEVLVRAAWAGFPVADIPIGVYYPPREKRVSHFHPFMDNLRLTLLNTRLTTRAIMPIPQKRFVQDTTGKITVLRPMQSIRLLLSRNETPRKLAISGAIGVFIGTLPILGIHSITILVVLGFLRYNKFMGLATSQLCIPPFVPALCIQVGHYMRHGSFLTELSWQTIAREGLQRLWEWFLGSLVLAPVLAVLCGLVVYALALMTQRSLTRSGETA
jgi:glycosyltransferase involved in cell wall biosynthesis